MRYLKVDPSSGVWQFRYKLPTHARFIFGVTEITKSLRTNNKRLATILALKKEVRIPEQSSHRFRDDPDTHSVLNRTPFPG